MIRDVSEVPATITEHDPIDAGTIVIMRSCRNGAGRRAVDAWVSQQIEALVREMTGVCGGQECPQT